MSSDMHYSKAPITEAIIDIKIEPSDNFKVENFSKFIDADYPEKKPLKIAHAHFQLGDKTTSETTTKDVGFVNTSSDKLQIFQCRNDGFTFSRLAPYDRWQTFSNEAKRLWKIYKEIVSPKRVSRIAVRYVNRIDLPLPIEDLKPYLKIYPEISSELSFDINHFFLQLQIPVKDIECKLLINETMIPPPSANLISIVLDIDLFKDVNVPQDDDEMWKFFEVLRLKKNEIFESCLTDITKKLINPNA